MSCGVGSRGDLDPMWLWLWRRPAAVAPIQPLAWEPPYAAGAALKKKNTKRQTNKQQKKSHLKSLGKLKLSRSSSGTMPHSSWSLNVLSAP